MCFITLFFFFFFFPLFPSFFQVLLQILPCFSIWGGMARIYILVLDIILPMCVQKVASQYLSTEHNSRVSRYLSANRLGCKKKIFLRNSCFAIFKAGEMNRTSGFSTVALVALSDSIPLSAIAHELVHCLNLTG